MSIDQLHRGKVAVLGLGMCLTLTCSNLMSRGRQGISGVTAVKNLIEQGFEVTGFERNDYIGGLWQKNLDPSQTTALKGYAGHTFV